MPTSITITPGLLGAMTRDVVAASLWRAPVIIAGALLVSTFRTAHIAAQRVQA